MKKITSNKINFVIPHYKNQDGLMTILNSLRAQTSEMWTCDVVRDGWRDNNWKPIRHFFRHDTRIRFHDPFSRRHSDWGHTPRNYGLQQTKEPWVVMTGDDNYYTPIFVEEFQSVMNAADNINLIYCDFVHNGWDRQYALVKSELKYGKIDMGSFCVRTAQAQQIGLKTTEYAADWLFVADYITQFQGVQAYIPKILYVHN